MLHSIASRLDMIGLRRPLAMAVSLAYPHQHFSIDERRNWINAQDDCTIVSPTIHTAAYAAIRDWVIDTWCFAYTPKEGDLVVEVGAGVGEEAVVFSKVVGPRGRIIAIEAHPATFACLAATVTRSNLKNVEPVECALGDSDGTASINTSDQHLANSIMSGGDRTIAKRSLDSLVVERDIGRIDFLKMNIEGAEKLAIQGMARSIDSIRNICISCHDFVADATGDESFRSKRLVHSFLEASGFEITTRPRDPLKPWIGDYLYGSRR